jgi:hypothetical protein
MGDIHFFSLGNSISTHQRRPYFFLFLIFLVGLIFRSFGFYLGKFYEADVYIYMAQVEHCIQTNCPNLFKIYYASNASFSEKPFYILAPYFATKIIPSPFSIYFLSFLCYLFSFILVYSILDKQFPTKIILLTLLAFAIYPIFIDKSQINNWRGETYFFPILLLLAYLLLKRRLLLFFVFSIFVYFIWNGAIVLLLIIFLTFFFDYLFYDFSPKTSFLVYLLLFPLFAIALILIPNPFLNFLKGVSQLQISETRNVRLQDLFYYFFPLFIFIPFSFLFLVKNFEKFTKSEADRWYISFIFASFLIFTNLTIFQIRWVSLLKAPLLLLLPFGLYQLFENKKISMFWILILISPLFFLSIPYIKPEFFEALSLIKENSKVLNEDWSWGGYIEYYHSFPYTDSGPLQNTTRIRLVHKFFNSSICNFSIINFKPDYIFIVGSNFSYSDKSCFNELMNNRTEFHILFKKGNVILFGK